MSFLARGWSQSLKQKALRGASAVVAALAAIMTVGAFVDPSHAQGATGVLVVEVWDDVDGDGRHGPSEPLLGGIGVAVNGPQFPAAQGFTTEADASALNFGRVVLPGMLPGTYTVVVETGDGWRQTGLVLDGAAQPLDQLIAADVSGDPDDAELTTLVEFGIQSSSTAPTPTPTEAVAGEMTPGPSAATPMPRPLVTALKLEPTGCNGIGWFLCSSWSLRSSGSACIWVFAANRVRPPSLPRKPLRSPDGHDHIIVSARASGRGNPLPKEITK